MEEMNPRIRMRLGPPKELPWHVLTGMRFQIPQKTQEVVGAGGSGTGVIRPGAADRARLPINGMGWPGGHKGRLKRRQPRVACLVGEAGHRPYTSGTCGDSFVAWHRHRRHPVIGRELEYTLNLDKV